jgi:glucosyl-3-phosphoglycerate synthase
LYTCKVITFAVIGHNEAPTLEYALSQASEAAMAGDVVWFIDSASTDQSKAIAKRKNIKRLQAPIGKGRAMRYAIEQSKTEFICFIDADLLESPRNLALILAKAVRTHPRDMLVGDFEDGSLPGVTLGIYKPLVASLFPEAADRYGSKPLSGFRIIRKGQDLGQIPNDFGVEAHLNITLALANAGTSTCSLGIYKGRFLYKSHMGLEVSNTILNLAVSSGRLDTACRPAWEGWVHDIVKHLTNYHGDLAARGSFESELCRLATRPLPKATL